MTIKVLVAYATKNWSTAEIARTITEVLHKEGLAPDMRLVSEVGDLQAYDAVVLGSPLYENRWHKNARRFLNRNAQALAARPVWLFSSGPLDASASERDIPPVPFVRRALIRVNAREHVTFGGCLEEGAKGRIARMIIKSGKGGDYRDFARIADWTRHIGATLRDEFAVREGT
ncbi:flavodoxin domain-containing protein [Streptomyces formicae]|uniref:Flavodoxin n=1 Tax=Streptomyces formicae TaxID=1616117 RepID=A0A291QL31_9ACTN|nr:flavodoxin domain-containing protein [Streptomyces formicae]ATL32237.1 flavodoxin [Streptomyces formicae]